MYSCSGEYSTRRAPQYSESAAIASREEGAEAVSLDSARLDSTDLTHGTMLRACSTSLSPLLAPCPLCELAGALCVGAPGRVPCKVEDAKLIYLQMIPIDRRMSLHLVSAGAMGRACDALCSAMHAGHVRAAHATLGSIVEL